jgi:conjugative transfer signal peptidase TraF
MNRKRLSLRIAVLGLTAIGIGYLAHLAGLKLNTTISLPQGLYWSSIQDPKQLKRGDIVLACADLKANLVKTAIQRGYIHDYGFCPGDVVPLMKPVAAIPGDKVTVSREGVRVNSNSIPHSESLDFDSEKRKLKPYPPGVYTVKPGEVWLISDYSNRSFDSRYFGPIRMSAVQGTAQPILIWDKNASTQQQHGS